VWPRIGNLEFEVGWMMKRLLIMTFTLVLAGCGGGEGDSSPTDAVAITWEKSNYEVATTPLGTATYEQGMTATVTGLARDSNGNLPQIAASLSYSPQSNEVTFGNGPHWMNSSGSIPIRATVYATTAVPPTYPTGAYDVTVSFNIKNGSTGVTKTYAATTQLVVR
jgi:hypothetical protein